MSATVNDGFRTSSARKESFLAPTVQADQLSALESEAIHIIREVAGEFDRPVILFSGGKDSMLLVHLARKAFWPAPVPFPVLHVDTGHNFDEVIEFRDAVVERYGLTLEVAKVQDYLDDGRLTERADGTRNPLQTTPLLDAIADHRHDAVFGGGRRDEERARAKERIFSLRTAFGAWEPVAAAPRAVEPLQRAPQGGRARARLPALELDRARRLALHRPRGHRAAVDLLRAHPRRLQPRRHVAHQRPVGRPARRRGGRHEDRPLPHRRRRVVHRRRRVDGAPRSTRCSTRSASPG